MAAVNLKSLVGKLNNETRQTLESAAGLCLSRTNYNVEIEHWLSKLLEIPNSDIACILKQYEVDTSRLTADLTKALDRLKTGNARPPALSPDLVQLVREAWLIASIEYSAFQTRSGHLLYALLSNETMARFAHEVSEEFRKIAPESLRAELAGIISNSDESGADFAAGGAAAAAPGDAGRPTGPTKTPSLDQFTIDLTARAKAGEIDPVLGRDPEIRQIIDILTRRRQNNPILTGEAGVGKTAVVEGFALRIIAGDVPPSLQNVAIKSLDLTLLQAGAGMKGEFENRLRSVIDEVKSSPQPVILFIDEAHTMIGAGGQAGQGDAANLLKPALARGELRTIAATTWAEYKKYFERDAALARRFQVVKIEEPTEASAVTMMRGLAETLENHHNVRILEEAIEDAVKLSHRYITGRQLPDKSVSLLDTACAKVAIGHAATPPAVEDGRRRIEQLAVSIGILQREQATGGDHAEKIAAQISEREEAKKESEALENRWTEEKRLVAEIRDIRAQLESVVGGNGTPQKPAEGEGEGQTKTEPAPALTEADLERLRGEQKKLNAELEEIQGETPLMQVCVDGQSVAEVVASWTGIPVGRMVSDEISTILNLDVEMQKTIIGQDHALNAIAQKIRTSRAQLADERTPVGVFLLAGTSGVGKTETAITLVDLLYGGEQNMTTINMSEFKEEHKVSLLMGSPPGYVGYGEGGVLTEAVRRKPYSVVLLDEMEKAHPGVQDVFYQVFDKGNMKDGEGRDIDFKNTVIIMTTNAGTDLIMSLCADEETRPDPEGLAKALHEELLKTFKPAFIGRLTVVPYFPLTDDVMKMIIKLKLGKVGRRISDNYNASFNYTTELVNAIAARCTEVDTGARNVDHILSKTLLPELSAEFLSRMAEGGSITSVEITVNDDDTFQYNIS